MRAEMLDCQSAQPAERKPEQADAGQQGLMTPERRAALDALEREFQDLLKAAPAKG